MISNTLGTLRGDLGRQAVAERREEATLKGILPGITSVEKGIAGKPTVQFHGCNVQIVNGAGETTSTNGAGNLVIGYDEHAVSCVPTCHEVPYTQTGSHNLLFGTGDSFTSYGGLVGGFRNTAAAPYASTIAGEGNTASGGGSIAIRRAPKYRQR